MDLFTLGQSELWRHRSASALRLVGAKLSESDEGIIPQHRLIRACLVARLPVVEAPRAVRMTLAWATTELDQHRVNTRGDIRCRFIIWLTVVGKLGIGVPVTTSRSGSISWLGLATLLLLTTRVAAFVSYALRLVVMLV